MGAGESLRPAQTTDVLAAGRVVTEAFVHRLKRARVIKSSDRGVEWCPAAIITEAAHSPTLIYLSGLLTLPLGLAILNVYRAWTADWRVIVTILGWLLAIGGVIRIVLPQFTATLATTLYSTSAGLTVFAVVVLVLGGYLSFDGYRSLMGE